MSARILDGRAIAKQVQAEITADAAEFQRQTGVTPRLAAVLVGDDPASEVYVRNKRKACERCGMDSLLHHLPGDTSQAQLLELIASLNGDPAVHGILVQLPLPKAIDEGEILLAVDPLKDVDAFHPYNVGLISQGQPRFLPCTPAGVQQILMRSSVTIPGAHVVILGRSHLVGRPLANLLSQRGPGADATVTLCHSRTRNLAELTRQADILVAAIGQAEFVKAEMIRPGAVVIDVGTNKTADGRLVGDVDFAAAVEIAGAITPVPGGVGPMTITMLLANTLTAARMQTKTAASFS